MSRGRDATHPGVMPWRGWLDILRRVLRRQGAINLGLIAAGIAFYGLLSLFPGITAMVALAGLLVDPSQLAEHSAPLAAILPDAAERIVLGQVEEVLETDSASLSFAALATLALALFSASRAVYNFIIGLNLVYDEEETRGFLRVALMTLLLTVGLIAGLLCAVLIVAALPVIAAWFGGTVLTDAVMLLRWPVLLLIGALGIAVLFRYAPDRRNARWRWLTPGALFSCLFWVAGSFAFSAYVQSFGMYNETFGALGGVIILLTWLWLSAFIVLLGALLDAEMEAQTARDSTVGKERPRGSRGAVKADRLGETRA